MLTLIRTTTLHKTLSSDLSGPSVEPRVIRKHYAVEMAVEMVAPPDKLHGMLERHSGTPEAELEPRENNNDPDGNDLTSLPQ